MIPQEHVQEQLSLAYVQSVAAVAGVTLSIPKQDYGIDGYFQDIEQLNGLFAPSSDILPFQLKSTTRWKIEDNHIIYRLEAKALTKLVEYNRRIPERMPCLLILMTMPRESTNWIQQTAEALCLHHCCYWTLVETSQVSRILRIPQQQQLTPQALHQLLTTLT